MRTPWRLFSSIRTLEIYSSHDLHGGPSDTHLCSCAERRGVFDLFIIVRAMSPAVGWRWNMASYDGQSKKGPLHFTGEKAHDGLLLLLLHNSQPITAGIPSSYPQLLVTAAPKGGGRVVSRIRNIMPLGETMHATDTPHRG